jgi:hypothetical protein
MVAGTRLCQLLINQGIEMLLKMPTRIEPSVLGATLKRWLPFDSDYARNDATAYEAYRRQAIACLLRHHDLTEMAAYMAVDDAIAAHERLLPGMMIGVKD